MYWWCVCPGKNITMILIDISTRILSLKIINTCLLFPILKWFVLREGQNLHSSAYTDFKLWTPSPSSAYTGSCFYPQLFFWYNINWCLTKLKFVLIPGCRREVQNPGHHRSAHQAARHRRKQDQDPRPRSAVSPACPGPLFHQDWPHRGRDPHPVRHHPQEGRSPWTQAVEAYSSSPYFIFHARPVKPLFYCNTGNINI